MIKILLAYFVFTITTLNAQEKSPTKDDAILWIIEKFNNYGNLVYHKRQKDDVYFYHKNHSDSYTIDFKLLTNYKIEHNRITLIGKNEMIHNCSTEKFENCDDYNYLEIDYRFINWDAEENLFGRFQKAIDTIINHNKTINFKEKF